MKLKNILFGLTVTILSLFSSVATVKAAAPDSFNLIRDTANNINYNEDIVEVAGSDKAVHFPLKYSESGHYLVFCTGDRTADTENSTFNKTTFTNEYDGAIVAAIIKAGVGENATLGASKTSIFFTQLAIWKSIPNTSPAFAYTESALNSDQRALLNSLISAGALAKTRYNNIRNFTITTDSTSLNFTLNGDVYESQVIKVSGNEIGTKTASVNLGTVVEKDGGYVVRIDKSLLSKGKNTITLQINATSNSISIASNYTNGRSNQQTITITQFDKYSKTASKTITGDITVKPNTVSISKQDATTGKELPDANLELTRPDGTKETWVSGTVPYIIKNLVPGKYTLKETCAPKGYIKTEETVEFIVDKDGKVAEPVVMKNYPEGTVEISKQDGTTGKELPGATIELTRPDGTKETWVSGTEPHMIKNLVPGKYTLKETIQPKGYKLSEETVEFIVDKDGKVAEPVVMKNYPEKTVLISKQDITTGKELYGATLEVRDAKGNLIESWTSGKEPHPITNLNPGRYTLTETYAPDGYKLSKETIEFVVNEDGEVKDGKVIMYNEPYPEVPVERTSSFKTITTSIIGLMIIGLGAMIIIKNYKKNEE